MSTLKLLWRLGRFHRPVGVWLILCPAIWGLLLSSEGWPPLKLVLIFIGGSLVMRSLGCTINDILDRRFDAQVTRTKDRPLANGTLNLNQALLFLAAQMVVGVLLAYQLNRETFLLTLVGGAMTLVYPLLKRWTHWPQLWLGFIMNWGLLLGLVAQKKTINFAGFVLYIGCVFWTLGYDTIYAFQDLKDDTKIGVKSSAIVVQNYGKQFIYFCYSIFFVSIILACYFTRLPLWCYGILSVIILCCSYSLYNLNLHIVEDCQKSFKSNQYLAILITILLIIKSYLNVSCR